MARRVPDFRRSGLILAAGSCLLLLLAADPGGLARIALFEPAGQKQDVALSAVLATMADSVELSLDVLQRYEVKRLPSADPAKDLDKVRAFCQQNRVDQAILGSGKALAGGGYQFRLVVYDRRTDSITIAHEGSSTGALDMFDVTDTLVASLLDGLSGTHVLFGSLTVESDPAGAAISVNGKDVGTAPLSLRGLPVGTIELAARAEGREGVKTNVTIADGETTDAPLTLARSTGTLAVMMPKDAVATVRSAEVGQKDIAGPGTTALPTGDYDVQASCPGLPAVSTRVTVARNTSARWLPWPKGYLDVQSVPAGTDILVDGVDRGVAPLVVDVEPGASHRVELRKAKYETYRTEVTAVAGDKTSLAPEMTGLPGSIRVETSMPGAFVKLDDQLDGVTPFVFEKVEPGQHVIRIANVQVNKRDYTVGGPIDVDVGAGETALVSKTFVPGTAMLTIEDAPPGSTVQINGASVDSDKALTTGIEVPAGSLDLVVQGPGTQKWTSTTFVGANLTTQRSIYSMTWQLPRRTITVDGKTDDWAGLAPMWIAPNNYNSFQDQPGTNIARGYACRDDRKVYFRYDFSNGSPRADLSKAVDKVLAYSTFLYTKHKGDEVHININFTRSLFGSGSAAVYFVWNQKTKLFSTLGDDKVSYKVGDSTLEISVPFDGIKTLLADGPPGVTLNVANADNNGNWHNHNGTEQRIIEFGL